MAAFGRALCAAAFFFAAAALAQGTGEPLAVPALSSRVIDQTATLGARERAGLEARLAGFEQARGSQVVVLLVASTGTETLEEYAGRVTDAWALGRRGVDDGVLFVIAKQDRRMRIHTGRGVQGTLTDALAKRIVAEIVAPRLRAGDFTGGIDAGVDAILKAIEGEGLPPPARPGAGAGTAPPIADLLVLGFIVVPIVAMVLRGLLGRLLGSGLTAGLTGGAAWLLLGSLAAGLVAAVLALLLTIFSAGSVGRGLRRGTWGGGHFPGGWGGGGGGSWGGGGGGFSGGGGGFDGGGASGGW